MISGATLSFSFGFFFVTRETAVRCDRASLKGIVNPVLVVQVRHQFRPNRPIRFLSQWKSSLLGRPLEPSGFRSLTGVLVGDARLPRSAHDSIMAVSSVH